ncbi:MAG TPA: LPS export ABC transporter periplasmic protein LptC [Gemmatimonadales bacterium]|nr:LPS export ABC transporter periplasmic protein LptC [Gemmatimonadales bacterium]
MRRASREGVERDRQVESYPAYDFTRRLFLTFLLDAFVLTSFACSNGAQPSATITAADTADQVLIDMTHYVTNDGVVRARVRADSAFFYQNSQSVEMRAVHITFYDTDGRETSTMSAKEGTYHWATGDMEGRGNVVVVGAGDGRTLKSEVMRYKQATNQVSSDQPFVFDGPPDRHIKGKGFTSDPDFRNVTALNPTGKGGHLVLPNQ